MDELTPEQLQELDTNIKGMLDGGGSQADVEKYASDYREFIKKKAKEAPSKVTTPPLQNGGQTVSNNTPTTSTAETTPLDLLTGRWKQNLPQQNLQNNQQTVTPQQNNLANNEIGNWGNVNGGGRGGTVAPDDIDLNTKLKGGIRLKLAESGVQDIVKQPTTNFMTPSSYKEKSAIQSEEKPSEYKWSSLNEGQGEVQAPNYSTGVTQQQITEKKKVPFEPTLTPPEPKTELDKKVQEVRSKYADTYWDEIQKNKDLYLDKNIQTKDGLVSLSQVDSYLDKDVRYTPSRLLDEHLDEVLNKDPNLNGADKFQIKKDIEARIGQLKTQEDVVKLAGVIYQDKSGKIAPDFSMMLAPDMMQKISDDTKINAEQIVDNAKNVSAKNLYDQYSTGKITKQQYSDGIDKLNDDVNLKLDALYKGAEESAKQSLAGLGLSEQDLESYSKSYGDAYGDYLVAKNKESYNVWKNYDGITKLSKGIDLGVYQMMESVGGMMAQQGMYDLADNITKTTGQITEGMQVPNMGAMEWESLSDPVWWATHAVPSATSSALFMIPSIGIGVATGGLGLGLLGQGVVAGVANRTLESYTESGDTFNQAIKNGMSVEDASKAAAKVWKDNMYLTGLDAMQMALLFTPMGSTVAKIAKGVVEAGTEAWEEIYQSYSSSKALGQFKGNIIDFAKSPEGIESGFLGALLGVTTSGLSDSFKLKEGTETQAQTQKMYNMLMQDGGENIPKRASYIRTMIGDMVMNGSMTPEESKTALNTLAFVQHNLEDSKGDLTKKQVEELGLKYYQVKLKDEIKNAKTDYEKESKQEKLDNVEAFILDSKDKIEPIELTPTKTEDVSAQPSEEVKVDEPIAPEQKIKEVAPPQEGDIVELSGDRTAIFKDGEWVSAKSGAKAGFNTLKEIQEKLSNPPEQKVEAGSGGGVGYVKNIEDRPVWNNTGTKFNNVSNEGGDFIGKDGKKYKVSINEDGIDVYDENGKKVGWAVLSKYDNGDNKIIGVSSKVKRAGITTAMYDFVDSQIGKVRQSGNPTEEGSAFWDANKPKASSVGGGGDVAKPTFENVPILTRTAEEIETAKNEVFDNLNRLEVGSVIENSDGEIKVVTEKTTDKKGNQLIGIVTYERQEDGSLRQMTNIVWASKSADGKIKLDYNPHSTGTNSKGERVTVTDQITDKKIDLSKENIFTEDENGNLIQINKVEQPLKETPKAETKKVEAPIPDVMRDDKGEPITFYHGTSRKGITELEPSSAQQFGKGIYFGSDKNADAIQDFGDNGQIFEVHLPSNLIESREYHKIVSKVESETGIDPASDKFPLEKVNDEIKKRGYKGIIMDNDLYGGKEVMVFDKKDVVYKKAPIPDVPLVDKKPVATKNILGTNVEFYEDYLPPKEKVNEDAMYSFKGKSKSELPELLQDRATISSKGTMQGKYSENWVASIDGKELKKLYEPTKQKSDVPLEGEKNVQKTPFGKAISEKRDAQINKIQSLLDNAKLVKEKWGITDAKTLIDKFDHPSEWNKNLKTRGSGIESLDGWIKDKTTSPEAKELFKEVRDYFKNQKKSWGLRIDDFEAIKPLEKEVKFVEDNFTNIVGKLKELKLLKVDC